MKDNLDDVKNPCCMLFFKGVLSAACQTFLTRCFLLGCAPRKKKRLLFCNFRCPTVYNMTFYYTNIVFYCIVLYCIVLYHIIPCHIISSVGVRKFSLNGSDPLDCVGKRDMRDTQHPTSFTLELFRSLPESSLLPILTPQNKSLGSTFSWFLDSKDWAIFFNKKNIKKGRKLMEMLQSLRFKE